MVYNKHATSRHHQTAIPANEADLSGAKALKAKPRPHGRPHPAVWRWLVCALVSYPLASCVPSSKTPSTPPAPTPKQALNSIPSAKKGTGQRVLRKGPPLPAPRHKMRIIRRPLHRLIVPPYGRKRVFRNPFVRPKPRLLPLPPRHCSFTIVVEGMT